MAGEGFDPCPRNGMSYVVGDTEVPLAVGVAVELVAITEGAA